MANLDLAQDVANKRERKYAANRNCGQIWSSIASWRMRRYGSLINIHPSVQKPAALLMLHEFGKNSVKHSQNCQKLSQKSMKTC